MSKKMILLLLAIAVYFLFIRDNGSNSLSSNDSYTATESYVEVYRADGAYRVESSKTITGSRDNLFKTNRTEVYPLEFDEPLTCWGFNMDYRCIDVIQGYLSATAKFKVWIHTTAGDWIGVKLFTLDKNAEAFLNITFDRERTIDAVMVTCQQDGVLCYDDFILLDPG